MKNRIPDFHSHFSYPSLIMQRSHQTRQTVNSLDSESKDTPYIFIYI